jgi:hypothetical protein
VRYGSLSSLSEKFIDLRLKVEMDIRKKPYDESEKPAF